MRTQMFIDGEYVGDPGAGVPVLEPATNEELCRVATATLKDVDRAVAAARREFDDGPWPRLSPYERGRVLQRIADGIRRRLDELARLEARNGGKPIADARREVAGAAMVFDYYAGAAEKFFGETIPMGSRIFDFTLREPVGVAGQIVPWNFAFLAASWKLGPALAAGCTSVLKPATLTPLSALALGDIATEAGVPAGVLNVVPGPGAEIGAYMAAHPGIDKIAFTGATATGVDIMKRSAELVKRVSLELGGKSANIVFADADVEKAAGAAVKAAFGNAGQSCSARTRILVERAARDRFVDAFLAATARYRIGDPLDEATQMGPLVSRGQWERVARYVAIGRREGAKLIAGGERPAGLDRGNYLAPAIFTDVRNDMTIAQEEIFGPVAAVITFDGVEEAIRIANDSPYGLNGSVWTRDLDRALRVVRGVRTGMVSVNSHGSASRWGLFAPFGGYKKSGIGRELGMYGLQLYTEVKNVFIELEEG